MIGLQEAVIRLLFFPESGYNAFERHANQDGAENKYEYWRRYVPRAAVISSAEIVEPGQPKGNQA